MGGNGNRGDGKNMGMGMQCWNGNGWE